MSNDKNKDVLKLLKSWGICDQYVSGVSIAASVDDLRTVKVNVEYCLPRGVTIKPDEDKKEEYKPKFKEGMVILFPWGYYYVDAVLVDKEGCISYRIGRSSFDSFMHEISVMSEQGLTELIDYSKGKRLKADSTESPISRRCCP